MTFGLLAIPASLVCCLTDGDKGSDSSWLLRESGPSILLEKRDGTAYSIDVTTACEDDIDTMEGKVCTCGYRCRVSFEEEKCLGARRVGAVEELLGALCRRLGSFSALVFYENTKRGLLVQL